MPPPGCEAVPGGVGEGVLGGVESEGRVGGDHSRGSGHMDLVSDGVQP